MICYLDSSVVLRKVFQEPDSLPQWEDIERGISSRLLRLEGLRVIDRMHHRAALSDEETAECRTRLFQTLNKTGLAPLTDAVLRRAEESFATPIGSLGGIHLATALLWRDLHGGKIFFATHDKELAIAARAHGFQVIGT